MNVDCDDIHSTAGQTFSYALNPKTVDNSYADSCMSVCMHTCMSVCVYHSISLKHIFVQSEPKNN